MLHARMNALERCVLKAAMLGNRQGFAEWCQLVFTLKYAWHLRGGLTPGWARPGRACAGWANTGAASGFVTPACTQYFLFKGSTPSRDLSHCRKTRFAAGGGEDPEADD